VAIKIYDTTLRDGMQGESITFTLEEKLDVARHLDSIGIHYIEGGFPLSNKKEEAFFKEIKKNPLTNARIASFGSTRRPGGSSDKDLHIKALLDSETPAVTIVGKSWTKHVTEVIGTDLKENLNMIADSVSYLKKQGREVIFDAEHFFDGFKENAAYAVKTVKVACENGADVAVLCDTNGGSVHTDIIKALEGVKAAGNFNLGVHIHNDTGLAVANSLLALDYGCTHIQGTINGWGERCGNANLCTIIPNIHFKIDNTVFTAKQLAGITAASRYISELANIIPDERQPYVGLSAFAHKAGQHADVINKNARLMEHLDSSKVGNARRLLLSELAGKSTIVSKLRKFGSYDKKSEEVNKVIHHLKTLENKGYEYEAAEASFELIIRKILNIYHPLFELLHYEVESFQSGKENSKTFARVKVLINERTYSGAATGHGPVGALDAALRDAITRQLPFISNIKLVDYKVRVLNCKSAAQSKVRVFITSSNNNEKWTTVGVSENIIEASYEAILDSFEYIYNNQQPSSTKN